MATVVNADDRSSDAHVPLDTRHFPIATDIQEVQAANAVLETAVLESVKITTQHPKGDSSPMLESSRGGSLSTNPDQPSDVASVHSLPAVHISESPAPESPRPSNASNLSTSQSLTRPSSVRAQPSQQQPTISQQTRRARHRSAIEVRSSNRLSGFFTNLINRHAPHPSTIVEDQTPPKANIDKASRTPSPPPVRTVTPPPALPPPTLQELGLSLSTVTANLSPAHFSTPPASGAFLSPHYLLLCHAQGLDVLPLISPPTPQPYALVRRVSFKSVVVMEHRGVLVAIAGRRDGVRVYALEEIKKAVEWRIDVEIRRERDRLRREAAKKIIRIEDDLFDNGEKKSRRTSLSTPPPSEDSKPNMSRKGSHGSIKSSSSRPPPLIPRSPRTPTRKSRLPSLRIPPVPSASDLPSDQPPPYQTPSETRPPPFLRSQPSAVSVRARTRGNSVSNVLANVSQATRNGESSRALEGESKDDEWADSSDDEAIDIRAAASGSQVLDERTSATLAATRNTSSSAVMVTQSSSPPRPSTGNSRRRPSNLNLSTINNTVPPQPSPVPTLLTLRQALQHLPPNASMADMYDENDDDDDETATDGRVSLAQVLWESRLPDLPPPGSVRPQQPILLSTSQPIYEEQSSPRSSDDHSLSSRQNAVSQSRDRRRWSTILRSSPFHRNNQGQGQTTSSSSRSLLPGDQIGEACGNADTRMQLDNEGSKSETPPATRPPTALSSSRMSVGPSSAASMTSTTQRSSRYIPRIISNVLSRRSEEGLPSPMTPTDKDSSKWLNAPPLPPSQPPPKLEYVKLPGTKGALMIKAVETQKKSFLAILCGDNGEKVELFAGTYRTALGLSRTFILPDSPRSLELQLQGDDLVEVFLVFSQNVFGLEPATVRVREVRIGRAERRAARRRARENRTGEAALNDFEPNEDETNVNVNIGVSVSVGSRVVATGDGPGRPSTPTLIASEHPDAPHDEPRSSNPDHAPTNSTAYSEELWALATAQMGPYTTFQQLSFSPKFPLASIADEYIIPPTYPVFLEHHDKNEQDDDGSCSHPGDPQTQFSPPGLPTPTPTGPTKWYYKDPKGVVHGPWASALMQAWYKDGLLPTDLPVRREEETEYTLLRDLRMQCVDPAHPFRSPPPVRSNSNDTAKKSTPQTKDKLLPPISLLSQPRHFGPPALFYSSRGGHSTTIVDARGRSVLKGRFIWSPDDVQDDFKNGKMGDVKRLEAFDVKDRSVLVALRQGGLEAVDLSDALLRPADQSRVLMPSFNPPLNTINRRPPFVWKIGTPINLPNGATTVSISNKKSGLSSLPRKPSIGIAGSQAPVTNDPDGDSSDEVLFLGRKDDEMYFCERSTGSFRVLKLSPNTNDN